MTWTNYHTHTYRCKHASGDVEDYARAAHEGGATVLGMSDHTALPDDQWPDVRMSYAELDDYEQAIADAQAAVPELRILKGMECEYTKEYHAFYQDELREQRQFDYLIGAAHYTPWNGEWLNSFGEIGSPSTLRAYTDYLCHTMATGLFDFIAHPDVFGACQDTWNEDVEACSRAILQAAADTQTPLEINGNGLRKAPKLTTDGFRQPYPWRPFWELATEYPIQVVCNSDAHHPHHVLASIDIASQWAAELNLEKADFSHWE